jgi:hypothetical protein
MKIAGLVVILAGWLITMSGLFITSSNGGRALFACAGIAVALVGSLGILNKSYLANAIWKQ